MSSLETLLEAAKFVECTDTAENGARAPDPPEFHHYAKPAPSLKRSNSGSDKSDNGEDGRDRKKQAGAGTREVHNKLEKNRRAHLKECFDNLKQQVPNLENHNKVSNLSILRGAYRYIQLLKRRETDLEQEMNHLACNKITVQMRIAALQKELDDMDIQVDVSHFLPLHDEDTRSVSTATAHNESPIMSEEEVEEEVVVETTGRIIDTVMDSTGRIIDMASPQIIPQQNPQTNKQQLSFCNVIVTSPSMPPPTITQTQSFVQNAVKSPLSSKPLFTIPLKQLGNASVVKASHALGSASSNNKTIAAMLNTSSQSLICDNLGGAKLSISAPELRTVKSTSPNVNPHPMSLLSAGGLSLVTVASQAQSPTVTGVNALNQQPQNTKIPVTQILQKTIAQRVQLQQLQKQLQQQQQQQQQQHQQATATLVVGTTATSAAAPTLNVSQVSGSVPQVITMNANALRPVVSALKTVPQIRPAVALNHQVLPPAFTLNTAQSLLPSAAATTTATVNSQPVNVATLNKLTTTTTTTNTLTLSTTRNATLISQLTGLTSTTSAATPGITGLNLATVKPVLTLPITQIPAAQLMSQHMNTLQQLMSQAVANKTVSLQATTTAAATVTTATTDSVSSPAILTPVSVTPVPTNLTAIPVTQFLPINVVSQGAGTATALNQTNITNNALNAQVLKSLGLPILQQSFSLPIKPIVMVSMPSKTTTAASVGAQSSTLSTPMIHVNLPVTHS